MKKTAYFTQIILGLVIIIMLSFLFKRSLFLILSYKSIIIALLYWLLPTSFIYGFRKTGQYFRTAFNEQAGMGEKKRAISYYNSIMLYMLLSAIAVAIAVWCYYLQNLDNSISRFVEILFLTPFYSLLFSILVILPLRMAVEESIDSGSE